MNCITWPTLSDSSYSEGCLGLINGILCFVDRAFLYDLFQYKPTGCTILRGIFISTSLHVSGNYVPIIRRTYCICATLVWVAAWSADQTAIRHSFSLEGRAWQEPEPSHVTGMALAHCILGKFLGLVCHCFPPPLDVPTLATRCLRPSHPYRVKNTRQ